MSNKEIAKVLKFTSQLCELHDENPFKIKALASAAFHIERIDKELEQLSKEEIGAIPGIGKSILQKIFQLLDEATLDDFERLIKITPAGVLQMLKIKGIGAKKVRTLWINSGIESVGELLYACNENRLIRLKGFGEKTQAQIIQSIQFMEESEGKMHFADAEAVFDLFNELVQQHLPDATLIPTGDFRRKMEVLDQVECIYSGDFEKLKIFVSHNNGLQLMHYDESTLLLNVSGKYAFKVIKINLELEAYQLFVTTGPESFVRDSGVNAAEVKTEAALFNKHNSKYILPELRDLDFMQASEINQSELVDIKDIKGILHCHSKYSDGSNTLKEMADACKNKGFEYFGICDHSQTAQYAGGLSIERVMAQHNEIEQLNKAYEDDFQILKGIESDILNDGSLDYPDEILSSFDFVVASIHSNLKMSEEKAMQRLIKAIENPFTSILGHMTGRLLLSRNGYPVDHKKIIEACAANKVAIELNAHPFRLDIDWRWIPYCMEKNVMIAINPDAHEIAGLDDIKYGVNVARKGGLCRSHLLNKLNLREVRTFFSK